MSAPRGRLPRLCQKELRETLRDRRTIITLVLMPLLVYPVLSMTLNRFLLTRGTTGEPKFVVGVATEAEGEWLVAQLESPGSQPPQAILESSGGELAKFEIVVPELGTPLQALNEDRLDVVAEVQLEGPPQVTLTAVTGRPGSEAARRILAERLTYQNSFLALRLMARAGLPPPPRINIEVASIGKASQQPLLATIVPLVLVLMTITGAVYPAIDLTAGERERGTMEALIASPVPRGLVLIAKYVAVVTVALLTAVANLGAMFVTLWAGRLLPLLVGPDAGFPWLAFVQIFLLLVLFSAFFSAVLLALTSFARSFKEAQAYLIPLMLLSLTPGVVSLFPDVHLTAALSVIPLLNIILMSREILAGTIELAPALVAILSTCIYAGAAIGVAARLFGSDAVLRGSEMSFAAAARRPEQSRKLPTVNAAAMTLAVIFPVYYLASNVLTQFAPERIEPRLILNAVVLIGVFGGITRLAIWYCRNQAAATYRLAVPRIGAIIGAVLLGLGLWTWVYEFFLIAEQLGVGGLEAAKTERVQQIMVEWQKMSPLLILATIAIAPGVVEELCFRGYLFSAVGQKLSPWGTIVVTALLFGIFHVLTGNALLIERFLPTTLIGLVLGMVAWRTGSVWPGILFHVIHNGFLELVAIYRPQLEAWGIGAEEGTHLPVLWLAAGTGLALTGAGLVWFTGAAQPRDSVNS